MRLASKLLPVGAAALFVVGGALALAADHSEADGTVADLLADIDDVYVWHTADEEIVAVVTFAGEEAGAAAVYDPDVLYTVHVDNDGDLLPDVDILVRFAQDSVGDWGVQFEGIPGSTGAVSGPVDTALDAGNGLQAIAGVFDDPFFADFAGYLDTLATGTLSFDSSRDSFAGKNVTAIVVEMDLAAAAGGSALVHVWATTGRR